MLRRIFFILKYNLNSFRRNVLKSLSLFLIILFSSFLSLVIFQLNDTIYDYLTDRMAVRVPNTDIVIQNNESNGEIIVDSDKLRTVADYIDNIATTFTFSSSVVSNCVLEDGNLISGNIRSAKLIGMDSSTSGSGYSYLTGTNIPSLLETECIVSNTYLKQNNLNIGDEVGIYINATIYKYKIVDSFDTTFFLEDSEILLQREALIKKYSYEMFGLNPLYLKDISFGNKIYISLKDKDYKETMIEYLKGENYYPHSIVKDGQDISNSLVYVKAIFQATTFVFSLILVALMVVLYSFLSLKIRRSKQVIGTLNSLGDKDFFFDCIYIETFIYSILGIIGATIIYEIFVSAIYNTYGLPNYFHPIKAIAVLCGFIIPLFISIGVTTFLRYQVNKKADSELVKSKERDKAITLKNVLIIEGCLMFIVLINNLVLKLFIDRDVKTLINFISVILFGAFLVPLFVKLVAKLFNKKANTFTLITLRNLQGSKIKIFSLIVLAVCFFGVSAIVHYADLMKQEIRLVSNLSNIEYCLFNTNTNSDNIVSELENDERISNVAKAFVSPDVSSDAISERIDLFVSMKYEDALDFIVMDELDGKMLEEFKNPNKRYIMLNYRLMIIYNLKPGDFITFKFKGKTVEYEIFAERHFNSNQIVYSNDYYSDTKSINTVVINTNLVDKESTDKFELDLKSKYGSKLMSLYPLQQTLDEYVVENTTIFKFIYPIIAFIVVAFLVSIISNSVLSFYDSYKDFAIISSLGVSTKELFIMYIKEILISFVCTIIPAMLMFAYFAISLKDISLLFNSYLSSPVNPNVFIGSSIISIITFILSYIYIFVSLKSIDIKKGLTMQN